MKENLTFENLKNAADSGERDAAYRVAERYEFGNGVGKSAARAAYYYQLASELGERRADYKLGEIYLAGKGVKRNDNLAIHYLCKAGQAGIAEAYTALGRLRETEKKSLIVAIDTKIGESEPLPEYARDYRLAAEGGDAEGAYRYAEYLKAFPNRIEERMHWLKSSDESGYAPSAYELALCYEMRNDSEKAFYYTKKAAEAGIASACYACGGYFEEGLVCKKDAETAFRCYEEAYRKGMKEASFPIAKFYYEGTAVKKDVKTAEKYLSVAIATNNPRALVFAGQLAEHGKYGTKQDETLAAAYYRRAAELGDADGKALYGKMLILGIGEPSDDKKAFRLISESAELGSPYGVFYLAYCNEKGFGTKIDFDAAIEGYREATKKGIFEAAERAKSIGGKTSVKELKEIPRRELPKLYRERFVYDFHNAEVMRPYERIVRLLDEGRYFLEGLYGENGLEAYLFFSKTERFLLLDFFAVKNELRGKGVGSAALNALFEKYPDTSVVIETEDPESARDAEDLKIRTRRIAFYERNGFRLRELNVDLFGDGYRIMTKNGLEEASELYDALNALYRKLYTERVAKKHIRLRFRRAEI